jgi:two-component system chemotaxis response regulator CheY
MAQLNPPRLSPGRRTAPLDLAPVVLIADNERPLLELFRDILVEDHFRVLTAANGREALALAEASVPDVLVTDVAMPHLDGFGLMRAVRCLYPGIPIIVMSGDDHYAGRPVETLAAELGAVATLMKPFDLSVLHEAVRRSAPPLLDAPSPRGAGETTIGRGRAA